MKILIAETTREEREKIVADSLGYMEDSCDGCMPGLEEMYRPFIEGEMELSEINMAFRSGIVKSEDMPRRSGCIWEN